jgi:hypothetical protein
MQRMLQVDTVFSQTEALVLDGLEHHLVQAVKIQ